MCEERSQFTKRLCVRKKPVHKKLVLKGPVLKRKVRKIKVRNSYYTVRTLVVRELPITAGSIFKEQSLNLLLHLQLNAQFYTLKIHAL